MRHAEKQNSKHMISTPPFFATSTIAIPVQRRSEALISLAEARKSKLERPRVARTSYDFGRILSALPVADVLKMIPTGDDRPMTNTIPTTEKRTKPSTSKDEGEALLDRERSAGFRFQHRDVHELEYIHFFLKLGIMIVPEGQYVDRETGGLALFLPARLRLRFWHRTLASHFGAPSSTSRSCLQEGDNASASPVLLLRGGDVEKALLQGEERTVRWSGERVREAFQRQVLRLAHETENFTKGGIGDCAAGRNVREQLRTELVFQLRQLGASAADVQEAMAPIEIVI
ncbi:unnamed protein product [Amoebophrya sp. A25]|nr:unnamed protein product [Amoebophrya sp. A25]|eukprot:GSA25T00019627001.1